MIPPGHRLIRFEPPEPLSFPEMKPSGVEMEASGQEMEGLATGREDFPTRHDPSRHVAYGFISCRETFPTG
jgi:hypothetical protein